MNHMRNLTHVPLSGISFPNLAPTAVGTVLKRPLRSCRWHPLLLRYGYGWSMAYNARLDLIPRVSCVLASISLGWVLGSFPKE